MSKKAISIYFIFIHLVLIVVLMKSDFIYRVNNMFNLSSAELGPRFYSSVKVHKKLEPNIPTGAAIFIGDSILKGLCVTAIYPTAINYGIPGDTTMGVLERLAIYGSLKHARLVVISVGINDLRWRDVSAILDNYNAIIKKIPKGPPIIFNAILPVNDTKIQGLNGMENSKFRSINLRLKKICDVYPRVYYADFSKQLTDNEGNLLDSFDDGDGYHLNSNGSEF